MGKKTHGLKAANIKLYRVWYDMRSRCRLITHHAFAHYGGRGIKVCEEWMDFALFYEWAINNGYTAGLSLDRIDTNGNYEPTNCRWATQKQQNNNKTDNRIYKLLGQEKTLMQWTEYYDINYHTVWSRIKRGWDAEKAISTPQLLRKRG